jgi:hypothetical protein
MQVVVTAVQNSVDRKHMGVATSSVTFFRSMGGAIGTALFGAILNTQLADNLKNALAALSPAVQAQVAPQLVAAQNITAIRGMPAGPARELVLQAFTDSMDHVFLMAVPFMAIALVVALTMREKALTGRDAAPPSSGASESTEPELATVAH